MTPRSRWLILGLALLGLAFASSSAWVHYKLLTDASYVSPCDINDTFNCTQVYLSRFGSVAGVPVALGGVIWFSVVMMMAGFARTDEGTVSPAGSYVFAFATIGLAVILYLGYVSFVVLSHLCLLCLGTYVSVIGIFIVSGFSTSVPMTQLPMRAIRDLRTAIARPIPFLTVILFAAAATAAVAYFPKEGTRPQAPQTPAPSAEVAKNFAEAWAQQPRVDLGVPADGAKVVIVKFNDYQCPGCRETHYWYKPILEKFQKSHPGAVKYVVKDWPWNSKCNFNTAATMHPGACEAAAAVRMGRDRGRATEMEDWLYSNQSTLTPASVRAAAEQILGVTDFDKEYALKLPEIRRDIADGGALSISITPTLFINGVRIDRQMMPAQYFELAIEIELNKAGK